MGPIKCAVCDRDYSSSAQTTSLVQIKYDTFICKPCVAVWYNDWLKMRNPWPHLPMFEGEDLE